MLGLLEQGGAIHSEVVPGHLKAGLQALLRGQSSLQTVLAMDGWRGYHGLADLEFERFCILRPRSRDRIEAFWAFTEGRLRKFYGLPGSTFLLHLKECEFRFNHRDCDLHALLGSLLRQRPL